MGINHCFIHPGRHPGGYKPLFYVPKRHPGGYKLLFYVPERHPGGYKPLFYVPEKHPGGYTPYMPPSCTLVGIPPPCICLPPAPLVGVPLPYSPHDGTESRVTAPLCTPLGCQMCTFGRGLTGARPPFLASRERGNNGGLCPEGGLYPVLSLF